MSGHAAITDERTAQVRLLRAVVDSASEPLWVIGDDGRVVLANAASAQVLGYARGDQLVGLPSHETLHHVHPDGSRYDVMDCPIVESRHQETRHSEEVFVARSGAIVPVTWSTKSLRGLGATLLSFTVRPDRGSLAAVRQAHDPMSVSRQRTAATTGALHRAELQRQIDDRFQDPDFSATVLARENNLSIRALQLLFAAVGVSPAAEIRSRRLAFARTLIGTGCTVQHAAFESGFRESGSFTRAFHKKYGMNPSQVI